MTKLTKISATALFALFLTACDKPADKAAAAPSTETPAAQTQAAPAQEEAAKPAAALTAEEIAQGKADLQKILDWNTAQEKLANEAQQKLQQELSSNDPKKAEAALVEFTKVVDETAKSLDAVEVKSPLVATFKAKTKALLTLSSEIVTDSVKVMGNPTKEAQDALAGKTQKLLQDSTELQSLQAELQAAFGDK